MFQLSVAQNFYARHIATNEFRFAQQFFIHNRARFKFIQIAQVDDCVSHVEGGVIETALGQTPDERHLTAFESKTNAPARARLLTFMAFAAGFSVTGAFAATESLDPMTRTRTRPEIM